MSEQNLSLPADDIASLVQDVSSSIPKLPDEQSLQGCAFDLRRVLISKAVQNVLQDDKLQNDLASQHSFSEAIFDADFLEDIFRTALPPMQTPTLRRVSQFSAWRGALLAVLGLLCGAALGQGLTGLPEAGLASGMVLFCGILGMISTLWFSEYILAAAKADNIVLPWGTYTFARARKITIMSWFAILVLAIVRDFFGGRLALLHLLESLSALLNDGNVLPFFTNIYGILFFAGAVGLLIKRPMVFDRDDFVQKLEVAAKNWWSGAQLAAKLLVENKALKDNDMREQWQKVGRDIYSFAGELPTAQKQWLTERLRKLGLEAAHAKQALTWHQDMLEHYVPLGHIDSGDACYVDEPPILEHDVVVRKGTVRKVR